MPPSRETKTPPFRHGPSPAAMTNVFASRGSTSSVRTIPAFRSRWPIVRFACSGYQDFPASSLR